jgi:hypothetical protein
MSKDYEPAEAQKRNEANQWIGLVFLLVAGGIAIGALIVAAIAWSTVRDLGKDVAKAQATANATSSFCEPLPGFAFRMDRDREIAREERRYLMENSYRALKHLGISDVSPPPEPSPPPEAAAP